MTMTRVSLLYGHPTDIGAFEASFRGEHLAAAGRVPGVKKIDVARVVPSHSWGSRYSREVDLWFDSPSEAEMALADSHARELWDFATGGVTVLIEEVSSEAAVGDPWA